MYSTGSSQKTDRQMLDHWSKAFLFQDSHAMAQSASFKLYLPTPTSFLLWVQSLLIKSRLPRELAA